MMCEQIVEALLTWRDDPTVALILLEHSGERGFCAGGDIRMLAESGRGDAHEARRFFYIEYQMNALLYAYPKPIVAILDGLVMGGGAGISLPAKYRIVTERTIFAMPETAIGLFPDVGGGWFLPRLHGQTGRWLALTGSRLSAADCLTCGIATSSVSVSDIAALKNALLSAPLDADQIAQEFSASLPPATLPSFKDLLDATFDGNSLEDVLQRLKNDGTDWSREQVTQLNMRSPQSLKLTFRQLQIGALLGSFNENMAMEYRIASRVVQTHDFLEGVRAALVDKDNTPAWAPSDLDDIDVSVIDAFFSPLPSSQEWRALD